MTVKLPDIIGWEIKKLRDIPKNQNDFVDGPFGSNLKVSDYTESGIRLIQLQNIEEGNFNDENKKFTSLIKFEQLKRHAAYPGDIAIAKMADPVARACIIPNIEERYLVVADCIKLSVDKENYDPKFIMHMINSPIIRKQALMRSTGSTRLRINLGELKKIFIPVPPLVEQRGIVEVLGTVDECIRLTDAVIERAEELKRDLMQQLLTRGIEHTEYKETPIGEIPKTWKITTLKELTKKITKGTTPTTYGYPYTEGGINFIKVENIDELGFFHPDGFMYISEDANNALKRSILKEGDILFSIAGALGRSATVTEEILPANTNQALSIIRLKDLTIMKFIKYFLDSKIIQNEIKRIKVQSAQANLTLKQVGDFKILIPPTDELKKIEEILTDSENKILIEKERKETLLHIKQGLMQLLLSGKIRVELKGDELHRIGDGREANN